VRRRQGVRLLSLTVYSPTHAQVIGIPYESNRAADGSGRATPVVVWACSWGRSRSRSFQSVIALSGGAIPPPSAVSSPQPHRARRRTAFFALHAARRLFCSSLMRASSMLKAPRSVMSRAASGGCTAGARVSAGGVTNTTELRGERVCVREGELVQVVLVTRPD